MGQHAILDNGRLGISKSIGPKSWCSFENLGSFIRGGVAVRPICFQYPSENIFLDNSPIGLKMVASSKITVLTPNP